MKELSIEQKARAYDEALEKSKRLYEQGTITESLAYIFPELKESEDEKIRKTIIRFFKDNYPNETGMYDGSVTVGKALTWLEKQGEKDILEDAILDGYILDGNEDGLIAETIRYKHEKQGRQNHTQEIEPFEAEHGKYYYCIKDYFCGGRKQASKGDVIQALRGLPIMGLKDASEYFLPVNSIKQKPAEWHREDEQNLNACLGFIPDEFLRRWLKDVVHVKYDKPAWSDEDERAIGIIKIALEHPYDMEGKWDRKFALDWLKPLKDRVQPKQEWNEEDEEMLKSVIATCELAEQERDSSPAKHLLEMQLNWLKSLKQRIGG